MATIAPVVSVSSTGVVQATWTGVSTADTMTELEMNNRGALDASLSMTGTWGSATCTLKACETAAGTYLTIKDRTGTAVSATADARFDIHTAARYLKPASTGGTADNVDFVLTFRPSK